MAILSVGVDIRWISDPMGAGVSAIFHLWVRPALTLGIGMCGRMFHFSLVGDPQIYEIGMCGRMFHFSLVGDPQIYEILDFDGFSQASPPKFSPGSKFWPNPIISPTHVSYRNPRCRSSYSPTMFFFWCSNPP
jgi:hypothetical protein